MIFWALVAQAADPVLPGGTVELDGTWKGQPFWLRLEPPAPERGGNRLLRLVYTPPPAAALGGTVLMDCPFLLVDGAGRLIAWNDRTGSSQVQPGKARGTVRVTRDRTSDHGDPKLEEVIVSGPRSWELTVAPVLLALAWAPTGAEVPVRDLFTGGVSGSVSWQGAEVRIAGVPYAVENDAAGRLRRLLDAQGSPVLTVAHRISKAP